MGCVCGAMHLLLIHGVWCWEMREVISKMLSPSFYSVDSAGIGISVSSWLGKLVIMNSLLTLPFPFSWSLLQMH